MIQCTCPENSSSSHRNLSRELFSRARGAGEYLIFLFVRMRARQRT